jgi:3'-5' exoribonuclease
VAETPAASAWAGLAPATDEVRLHLLHLIASHHGELAFGSPVVPKTPEAIVLHHVDNIDAKLEMFAEGYATSQPLAKNVLERRRPLAGNLVRPLAPVTDVS